jgi:signal recognition particle subunit SRP54
MTKNERTDITLLGKSRMKRIATGSGTNATEVNRFVKQFQMMKKMSKHMAGGSLGSKMDSLKNMGDGMDPSNLGMGLGMGKGQTKTQSPKKRFKQRKRR